MGKQSLQIIHQHDIQQVTRELEAIYAKVINEKKKDTLQNLSEPQPSKGMFADFFNE